MFTVCTLYRNNRNYTRNYRLFEYLIPSRCWLRPISNPNSGARIPPPVLPFRLSSSSSQPPPSTHQPFPAIAHTPPSHAPCLRGMSSAAALHCRKRRRDDAPGDASSIRRRLLAPSPLPAVRSFGLRISLSSATDRPCKQCHDESTYSARLCRSRRRLSTSPFPAVRPNSFRVALAPSPPRVAAAAAISASTAPATPSPLSAAAAALFPELGDSLAFAPSPSDSSSTPALQPLGVAGIPLL
ncbi:hypothetical protein PVAP13_2KG592201 [Panicum virgatum]|uniref:Uncharacterized protein n=1 Tax=Panicum virgatum TaxID=38727 RepID=A0A8T0WJZ7_PANVG|nr:hypothetical protein PVAP13_2KG592201 [Panicum virgatum]